MQAQSVSAVKAKSAASNSNQSSLCQQDAHTRGQQDRKRTRITREDGDRRNAGTKRTADMETMDLLSEDHTDHSRVFNSI